MNTGYSRDVSSADFDQYVLERSHRMPVVVDFWAEWCGPCRMLTPILARLAEEYQGQFELAKVNTDAEQELAMQFGIRSLPTVKIFKNGEIVDEILGAQPWSTMREFIDRHIDSELDRAIAQAMDVHVNGDTESALAVLLGLEARYPEDGNLLLALAQILLEFGQADEAMIRFEKITGSLKQSDAYQALEVRLQFAAGAADLVSEQELLKQLESRPGDIDSRHKLSTVLVNRGEFEAGMDHLLEIVRLERRDDGDSGRVALLNVFKLLGRDPLVPRYRSRLSQLLN